MTSKALIEVFSTCPYSSAYDRLIEYTAVIKELLASSHAVSYESESIRWIN